MQPPSRGQPFQDLSNSMPIGVPLPGGIHGGPPRGGFKKPDEIKDFQKLAHKNHVDRKLHGKGDLGQGEYAKRLKESAPYNSGFLANPDAMRGRQWTKPEDPDNQRPLNNKEYALEETRKQFDQKADPPPNPRALTKVSGYDDILKR